MARAAHPRPELADADAGKLAVQGWDAPARAEFRPARWPGRWEQPDAVGEPCRQDVVLSAEQSSWERAAKAEPQRQVVPQVSQVQVVLAVQQKQWLMARVAPGVQPPQPEAGAESRGAPAQRLTQVEQPGLLVFQLEAQ